MPRRETDIISFEAGFVPTQPRLQGIRNSLIDGRNMLVLANGRLRSARGPLASGPSGSPRPMMNVSNTFGGITNNGTIILFYDTRYAAGSGNITVAGAVLGAVSGQLMVEVGSVFVPAGLTAPGAPVIADSGITGRNNGAFSLLLTAVRSTSGAESSQGIPSNPISLKNRKVRISSFPAVPAGGDTWGIYCSFRGFSTTGLWHWLRDIPASTPAPYDLDWLDGELGRLAPLDYDPPPTCTHCFSIDNVVVAAGAYGGYGLSPSVPAKGEAYPPDQVVFLSRGEPIITCKGSGFSGRVFIACANSFHEVVRSGSVVSPIITRPIWPATGFPGHSSWCVVGNTVYGYNGQPVRTDGSLIPDSSFGEDMKEWFIDNGFTATNTVVEHDPSISAVVYMSGQLAACFMLESGRWSLPIELPGAVSTAAKVGSQLLIDIGGTNHIFEAGAGGSFHAVPAFREGVNPGFAKTMVRMRGASDVQVQLDLLADLDTATPRVTKTSNPSHGAWHRLNEREVDSYSVKVSGAGAGKHVEPVVIEYVPHRVTRAA